MFKQECQLSLNTPVRVIEFGRDIRPTHIFISEHYSTSRADRSNLANFGYIKGHIPEVPKATFAEIQSPQAFASLFAANEMKTR